MMNMTNPINTDAAPSDQDVMISLLQSINDKLGHLVAEGEEQDRVNESYQEELHWRACDDAR